MNRAFESRRNVSPCSVRVQGLRDEDEHFASLPIRCCMTKPAQTKNFLEKARQRGFKVGQFGEDMDKSMLSPFLTRGAYSPLPFYHYCTIQEDCRIGTVNMTGYRCTCLCATVDWVTVICAVPIL